MLKGKTVAIEVTTLEATAGMRSIRRRDTGESHQAFGPGMYPSQPDRARRENRRILKRVRGWPIYDLGGRTMPKDSTGRKVVGR